MSKRKSKKSKNTMLIVFLVITFIIAIALLLYFFLWKENYGEIRENMTEEGQGKGGNNNGTNMTESQGKGSNDDAKDDDATKSEQQQEESPIEITSPSDDIANTINQTKTKNHDIPKLKFHDYFSLKDGSYDDGGKVQMEKDSDGDWLINFGGRNRWKDWFFRKDQTYADGWFLNRGKYKHLKIYQNPDSTFRIDYYFGPNKKGSMTTNKEQQSQPLETEKPSQPIKQTLTEKDIPPDSELLPYYCNDSKKCDDKCYNGNSNCDEEYCNYSNTENKIRELIRLGHLPKKDKFSSEECKIYRQFTETQAVSRSLPKSGSCFENNNCKSEKCVEVPYDSLFDDEKAIVDKRSGFIKYCK